MADNPQQDSLPPLLHGPSYIFNRNIFIQNLLRMPLHQVNGNRTDNNIDQISTNPVNSSNEVVIEKGGPQTSKNWMHGIINGALKCVLVTALAPINRVHLLMQCQNEMIKTGRLSISYKGIKDCFKRTIKHEGFFSLWRGNSINLLLAGVLEALVFAGPEVPPLDISNPPFGVVMTGAMAGNLIMYPLAYTRLRLANDCKSATGMQFSVDSTAKSLTKNAGNWQFRGVFDVVMKTLKADGFRGFYRGYTITCIGVVAYFHADRATKECFSTYIKEKHNQKTHTKLAKIALDFMMLVSIPVVFYPIGTVSKRMMMTSGEAIKYEGAIEALNQIVRKEGVYSLYKGVTPFLITRIAWASAAAMLLYFFPFSGIKLSSYDCPL